MLLNEEKRKCKMATKPRISKGVNDRVKFKRVEFSLFTVFTSTKKNKQANKQNKGKMKQI